MRQRSLRATLLDAALRMRSQGGNVALVFGLTLPVVVGGAAFGVETSYWYLRDVQLQSEADAAAYAGAVEKRGGSSTATVKSAATSVAVGNGFDSGSGTITVNVPPASGGFQNATAVEVV